MAWLVRNGDVLATAEIADSRRSRRRGLIGRESFEGALVLTPCRHVHTARMRWAIDVALCDAQGRILRTCTLAPWRVSPLLRGTAFVVEAEAGAFERWRLRVGDVVELRT
jgi:uncharacterized membrane protein (UPF0127 family)